jgi:hypothetical protein
MYTSGGEPGKRKKREVMKMTMRDKVLSEIRRAERDLSILNGDLLKAASIASREAVNDAFGARPGLALAHATLEVSSKAAQVRELANRIDMLKWLLADED